ncbi:hypothetical protein [Candidatus Nitrospira bockiana]
MTRSRKVLYLVKDGSPTALDLVSSGSQAGHDVSVVLIQDGVTLSSVPAARVYALSEDVGARSVRASYPAVSYGDVLRMMFEADSVIAL